jgi:hypothetical protein
VASPSPVPSTPVAARSRVVPKRRASAPHVAVSGAGTARPLTMESDPFQS